jgi:hypothetical protein
MKFVKALIIVLLISSCNKTELTTDRNVLFVSDSLNVFGRLSDSRIIYSNITYKLNIHETIAFERNYIGTTNHFRLDVFVDGVQHSLNNEYFFEVK